MAHRKPILFLTNSSYGQANLVLAVIHQLLQKNELDVHVASWAPLESRLLELGFRISHPDRASTTCQVTYHVIPGLGMMDAVAMNFSATHDSLPHAPGYAGMARFRQLVLQMLAL